MWDLVTKKYKREWHASDNDIFCIHFLKNGEILAGSGDANIKLWNKETKEEIQLYKGHTKAM